MRRSRADIMANILNVAQDGAGKMKLMYGGFLSYKQLREYQQALIDTGLLEFSDETRQFHTTDKGRQFLKFYEDFGKMIAPI